MPFYNKRLRNKKNTCPIWRIKDKSTNIRTRCTTKIRMISKYNVFDSCRMSNLPITDNEKTKNKNILQERIFSRK